MSPDLIKKIKDSPFFQDLQGYIIQQIKDIDTVAGLDKLSNDKAGEEAKIREKTKERLIEMLNPFLGLTEKKEPTEEEVQSRKDKFGL
jgi:hypothetical protein